MTRRSSDVVIIGGGIIGLAIARELAQHGLQVTVLERERPGRGATWAAAGMLSPLGEAGMSDDGGAFLEFADASLGMYARWVESLMQDSGVDVEYATSGKLHVSFDPDDPEFAAVADSPAARRFGVELMDGRAARTLEPAVLTDVRSAMLVRRDHRVNNRRLAQALTASAAASGAIVRRHAAAELVTAGGTAAGVRLASGEFVESRHVIVAAGAWSAQLEGLPDPLPVRPVRGQMYAVAGGADRQPSRVIFGPDCYIVPRMDGRMLIGATMEEVGFAPGHTGAGIAELERTAALVIDGIGELPVVEEWSGFRPATPDGLPVLGADPSVEGLIYATGHFRNGILLAPATAVCIAELVTGGAERIPIDAFSITRFSGASAEPDSRG